MSEAVGFDPSKIAAELVTHYAESAVEGAGLFAQEITRKIRLQLKAGFSDYLKYNITKTGYVKTILSADESVMLESIYVSLRYFSKSNIVDDQAVMNEFTAKGRVIVSGTAGGGKSIFLKMAYLRLAKSRSNALPLFFELRSLNHMRGIGLFDAIYKDINSYVPDLQRSDFDKRVKDGRFLLLLDGFDEIDHDIRGGYAQEIERFGRENESARVIITTRPEEDIANFTDFRVYHVSPMTKAQAVELLGKIEYDPDIKDPFILAVESSLYEKHREFLSNPLLTSMMLLTYGSFSDIPDKIYIFYQQAFEVLFQRHDRSKGVFTRKSHAGLAIDEFQRVFSYFCGFSYAASDLQFTDADAIIKLRSAVEYCELQCKPEELLDDLVKSTCLLQRDGTVYTFVHRSFQEYFAAVFISRLPDDEFEDAVNAIIVRGSDNVVSMLQGMDPGKFDRYWALPACRRLCCDFSALSIDESPLPALNRYFTSWSIDDERLVIYLDAEKRDGYVLAVLIRRFGLRVENTENASLEILPKLKAAVLLSPGQFEAVRHIFGRRVSQETFMKRRKFTRRGLARIDLLHVETARALGMDRWMSSLSSAVCSLQHALAARVEARSANTKGIFARKS